MVLLFRSATGDTTTSSEGQGHQPPRRNAESAVYSPLSSATPSSDMFMFGSTLGSGQTTPSVATPTTTGFSSPASIQSPPYSPPPGPHSIQPQPLQPAHLPPHSFTRGFSSKGGNPATAGQLVLQPVPQAAKKLASMQQQQQQAPKPSPQKSIQSARTAFFSTTSSASTASTAPEEKEKSRVVPSIIRTTSAEDTKSKKDSESEDDDDKTTVASNTPTPGGGSSLPSPRMASIASSASLTSVSTLASSNKAKETRSKTDNLDRLIRDLDKEESEGGNGNGSGLLTTPSVREIPKYVRRRYTDSRHPTTELPDVRIQVPEKMTVQHPPIRKQQKIKAAEALKARQQKEES